VRFGLRRVTERRTSTAAMQSTGKNLDYLTHKHLLGLVTVVKISLLCRWDYFVSSSNAKCRRPCHGRTDHCHNEGQVEELQGDWPVAAHSSSFLQCHFLRPRIRSATGMEHGAHEA
jgi:hypothetical protein